MKRIFNRSASPPRPSGSRRGVAMLLVLVALGTATVLSASYLASRRTAPAIGANAEISSNARWASASGANMGVAILQTSYALSGDINSDQLVAGAQFGLGDADALVTNSRGGAASATDSRLILSAIGSADRIGALSQRVLLRRRTNRVTEAVDPYMREFAVFAIDSLRLQNSSYIAPWPGSDRGPTRFVANIGVAFGNSGSLNTGGAGTLTATRLIVDDDANASLTNASVSATFGGGLDAGLQFPTASARAPQALWNIGSGGATVYTWNAGSTYTASRPDYNAITVTAGCTYVLDEDVSPNYSVSDLTITSGSTLRIKGEVRVLVRDDFEVSDRSNVELADENSSVQFYVLDDVLIDDSVFGLSHTVAMNTSRSYEDLNGAFRAAGIRVFLVDDDGGGDAAQQVTIEDHSIVIADIHAPAASVDMVDASVIIGRLTGYDIDLRNTSIVFYDHTLNPGAGLTDALGPLYDSDRFSTLRSAMASFDNAQGLEALIPHIEDEFAKAGIDPDPDEAGPVVVDSPDPRDAAKVVVVPMRRGSARAIEAGMAGGSFDSLLPVPSDSVLAQALGGVQDLLGLPLLGGGNGNGNGGGNGNGNGNGNGGGGGGGNGNGGENGNGGLLGGILGGLLGGN